MFKRFFGLVLAVGIALFVTAGCGGSSDQALTKAEFVQQGNEICESAEEERQKIISGLAQNFNPHGNVSAQQIEIAEKSMPPYEEAAEDLEDLGAPAGKSKTLEELVAAMEEASEKVREAPQTAVETDIQFKNANDKAEELKLDKCII